MRGVMRMGKRLSIADIYKEYPDQFIGITNIKYHGGVVLAAKERAMRFFSSRCRRMVEFACFPQKSVVSE